MGSVWWCTTGYITGTPSRDWWTGRGVVNGRGYYVSLRGLTILVFFETVVFGLFLGGMLTAQVSTLPVAPFIH